MFGIDDLVMGGIGLAGSAIGGALGYFGQKEANAANARNVQGTNEMNYKIAQERNAAEAANVAAANDANIRLAGENRDWQEKMSNTAYQRQVADMTAAGINPMLAIMKGGGASTPSGSVAQVQAPSVGGVSMQAPVVQNELEYLGQGLSSAGRVASDAYQAATSRRAQEAAAPVQAEDVRLKVAQTEQAAANIQKMVADVDNIRADTNVKIQSIQKMMEEIGLIRANRDLSLASARETNEKTKWMPTYAAQAFAGTAESQQRTRESEERTRWYGSSVDQVAGKFLKDTISEAQLRLGRPGGTFGLFNLFDAWDKSSKSYGTPSDAYRLGAGNVFGGTNSAWRSFSDSWHGAHDRLNGR